MALRRPPAIALISVAAFAILGCDTQRTTSIVSEVRLTPVRLDFGSVEVGQSVSLPLRIENLSRGPVSLNLASVPDGFTASNSQVVPGGTSLPIVISFSPSHEGPTQGTLRLLVDGSEHQVVVTGSGALPQCSTLPEGAACAAPCLTGAQCASGLCVGRPRSCDDGDACTVDACGPSGCQSSPRSCAAPANPCRVAHCDPSVGCAEEDALDGTSCGVDSGCGVRDVCLSGACVARPAPDGAACRTDRCRPEGRCQSGACLQPPGTAFAPRFVWPTIGWVTAMVLDEQDNLYVGEAPPSGPHPGRLVSITRDGQYRWSRDTEVEALLWTGDRLIVGSGRDVPLRNAAALLALDRDGVPLWSLSGDDLSTATYAATVAPRFVSLALDELGRLIVLTAGYDGRGPWSTLSVVDASTGAILERHRNLPRNGFGLILDGTGNLLWSSRSGDYSWTEPGVLHGASATEPWPDTWSRNTSWGPPVVQAALPGLAFASWTDSCFSGPSTRWVDTSTGALLTDTSVTFTGGFVANAATVWMLGSETVRSVACVEPEIWRAASPALFVFDRATGNRRATPVPVHASATSTLMLTASDSALWVSAPVDPEEPGEILEVDSSGAIASQCELDIGTPREALLGQGRFFVASGGAKFADRVVGVDAPGLMPAPAGWSSHLGNRFGHRRPD